MTTEPSTPTVEDLCGRGLPHPAHYLGWGEGCAGEPIPEALSAAPGDEAETEWYCQADASGLPFGHCSEDNQIHGNGCGLAPARPVPAAPAEPDDELAQEALDGIRALGITDVELIAALAAPAEPGATEVCPDCNHHPGDHYENADGCVEGLCFCRRVYAAEPGGECEHVRLTWEDGAYECDTCGRRGFLAAAPPAPADDEAVPEDRPPVWLLLDLWVAMGGDSTDFDSWWAADPSFPDRWAQMVAAVGGNISDLAADSNPPAGTLLDIAIGRQPSTSPAAAVPEERDES